MINVTLRQLRYFDALARQGHFGRAAEACAISQPALSMQIREMEEALGGALIERGARQVALTKFGEEIVQRVRDILRSVDELGDFARASRDRSRDARAKSPSSSTERRMSRTRCTISSPNFVSATCRAPRSMSAPPRASSI